MEKLHGNVIFEGIVIAKPYYKKWEELIIEEKKITESQLQVEISKVEEAIKTTKYEIKHLMESLKNRVNKSEIKILNVQLMMLDDPVVLADINNMIKKRLVNAEKVVSDVVEKYVEMFKMLKDPLYRERASDVKDVGNKIIRNLLMENPEKEDVDNKILITKELQPFEILKYYDDGMNILGIITEEGGETSHTAILAKALGIPTIMGVDSIIFKEFTQSEEVILDSRERVGAVYLQPDEKTKEKYITLQSEFEKIKAEFEELRGKTVFTKDGEKIKLNVNLGGEIEIKQLERYLPDGIGLLRTEFLYMDSDCFPSEEDQYEAYIKIYESLKGNKPLTIRTLDIGGDKALSYYNMPDEENPFLGLRAIRFSLANRKIFKTQLRAILRAAHNREIKMMYPMISSIDELRMANTVVEEVKKELKSEKKLFNDKIEIGIMVEVPSTAVMADLFVGEVDFFSVGTNDLTQYCLAADRLSKEVSYLYDKFNPAVIRLIANTADVALKNNKSISICGEMAGETYGIILFLILGIKELSMLPSSLPKAKKIIMDLDFKNMSIYKEEILNCKTSTEVKNILEKLQMERV